MLTSIQKKLWLYPGKAGADQGDISKPQIHKFASHTKQFSFKVPIPFNGTLLWRQRREIYSQSQNDWVKERCLSKNSISAEWPLSGLPVTV